MTEKKDWIKLDKFYTNEDISKDCIYQMKLTLKDLKITNPFFLEPSAGGGSFSNNLEECLAFDILPESENIIQLNYIKEDISHYLPVGKEIVTIGNPPFGKRSKLAIDFINKSFEYSKVIGFILPVQFLKYNTQTQIIDTASLIHNHILPENSFTLENNIYDVRCVFQIWTTLKTNINLRIVDRPPTKHIDFECYQYNCTKQAEKYFDYDVDFAILRQGYGDYNTKHFEYKDLSKKNQWIFIKANNKIAYDILSNIDYDRLSKKNTTTPGFGKADLISEYKRIKKEL